MKDVVGYAVPYAFDGTVKELLSFTQNKKMVRKLFYQTLAMPLHELENKKSFKVILSNFVEFVNQNEKMDLGKTDSVYLAKMRTDGRYV